MLAELREYARSIPTPENAPNVELVIAYLSALNNFFERSLLGNKVRVFDSHGSTIQRMEGGFKFFVDWADEQRFFEDDTKKFLAWQVCTCTL